MTDTKKQYSGQFKNICFTSFNMDIEWETLNIAEIDKKQSIKYLVYQGEYTKDKRKHIQGFLQLYKKKEYTFIKKLFGDNTLHIEPMKGTPEQASNYCKKTEKDGETQETFFSYIEYGELDTTIERQRTDLIALRDRIISGQKLNNILEDTEDGVEIHNILLYNKPLKALQDIVQKRIIKDELLEDYEGMKPNKLQRYILDIIEQKPDDRKVYWFYDNIGKSGKSYIAKYIQLTKETYYITGGKQNDILYGYDGEPIIIIDLARTYADNLDHIYTIIENFKNGQYLSTKYETKQKLFKIPHIIVMANFKPDQSKLSIDRWHIIDTDDYKEEQEAEKIEITRLKPRKKNIAI